MNDSQLRTYFSEELGWGWGYEAQYVFGFLRRAASAAAGGVVLDAGAGHQRYKPFFGESLYIAQEHPVAGLKNKGICHYDILCDVKVIPLLDESVDVVISTTSFEHMEYPEMFFSESFRVLKPGGTLWIQVPFVFWEHEVPYDFQRLTRYGLIRNYQQVGFERVEIDPTTSSTNAAISCLKYALREDRRRLRNTSTVRRPIARALENLNDAYCAVLARVFDRGPSSGTTLPMGWVATGYKPGEPQELAHPRLSSAEFLEAHKRDDIRVEFNGTSLVHDPNHQIVLGDM